MNVLKYVPSECKHNWDRYEDLPGGEDPLRYRKCTKCGQIVAVMAGEHRERFHIRSLPCHVCGEPAVGRNWGRRKYAARVRWVCAEHLKPRPIFEVLLTETECITCGTLMPAGARCHTKPVEGSPYRVFHFQCIACCEIEQGADR